MKSWRGFEMNGLARTQTKSRGSSNQPQAKATPKASKSFAQNRVGSIPGEQPPQNTRFSFRSSFQPSVRFLSKTRSDPFRRFRNGRLNPGSLNSSKCLSRFRSPIRNRFYTGVGSTILSLGQRKAQPDGFRAFYPPSCRNNVSKSCPSGEPLPGRDRSPGIVRNAAETNQARSTQRNPSQERGRPPVGVYNSFLRVPGGIR